VAHSLILDNALCLTLQEGLRNVALGLYLAQHVVHQLADVCVCLWVGSLRREAADELLAFVTLTKVEGGGIGT